MFRAIEEAIYAKRTDPTGIHTQRVPGAKKSTQGFAIVGSCAKGLKINAAAQMATNPMPMSEAKKARKSNKRL